MINKNKLHYHSSFLVQLFKTRASPFTRMFERLNLNVPAEVLAASVSQLLVSHHSMNSTYAPVWIIKSDKHILCSGEIPTTLFLNS